jgi:hypothetical protein
MFLHLQITQRHTPFSADTNTFSYFQKLGLKWQRNSSLKIPDSVSFEPIFDPLLVFAGQNL